MYGGYCTLQSVHGFDLAVVIKARLRARARCVDALAISRLASGCKLRPRAAERRLDSRAFSGYFLRYRLVANRCFSHFSSGVDTLPIWNKYPSGGFPKSFVVGHRYRLPLR